MFLAGSKADFSLFSLISTLGKGVVFDFGVSIFFSIIYALYLLALPKRWSKTKGNYIASYFLVFMMVLISIFSFFAELTFWQEFESRFNFIAVDYLIYTFEVINNINESYPLPILISSVVGVSVIVLLIFRKAFSRSFSSAESFWQRLPISGAIILIAILYGTTINNKWAENSNNRYQGELAKAGVYSFFAAFKNNELDYEQFYSKVDNETAFNIIRKELQEPGAQFTADRESVLRKISHGKDLNKPNVIMITIESFSASFMERFGNKDHLTPNLDSLAGHSFIFSNMYATGTRTVRGMEALSLAVPPTPGNSIVRRPNNENLSTVGEIFRTKGYETSFFYGGDGYFDNMNQYFSSNGFNIVDRGRKINVGDTYKTKRTIIPDTEVHFENAWGICDGDLYNAVLKDADQKFKEGKHIYDFVMTTSNHRPFTYPDGKIDIPSKSGRDGAVKYTDYAIGEFLSKARTKPWFKNTVFIFVADHCASSAGKNEIDISKYHIPCMIYNLSAIHHDETSKMCSQIDLYPTLFHLLGWTYTSSLYGKDVLSPSYLPRAILGTYQKLAYLKKDSLVILSPQQQIETYIYNGESNEQKPAEFSNAIKNEAIAYYQSAYLLYKSGKLRTK
ncbi:LTA synthase family protein [Desertivirga arenae]|uniref:LTA synthase family protein n=1 Tax=Desertivirga arenae TaxID=2810309 RepID=UPI001F60C8E0|nr:alkaline phosphatase family protein [Pedobacter sp. SYSU D00823]